MRKLLYYFVRILELIGKKICSGISTYSLMYRLDGFNKQLRLDYPVAILYPRNIKLGTNCSINRGVYIHAEKGVELGNNVTLSSHSKIITLQYDLKDWISNCEKNKGKVKTHFGERIVIGDDAWICAGATILPGVNISGRGVIVAANAVLKDDITEDYVLVAGCPAKVVKRYRKEED